MVRKMDFSCSIALKVKLLIIIETRGICVSNFVYLLF